MGWKFDSLNDITKKKWAKGLRRSNLDRTSPYTERKKNTKWIHRPINIISLKYDERKMNSRSNSWIPNKKRKKLFVPPPSTPLFFPFFLVNDSRGAVKLQRLQNRLIVSLKATFIKSFQPWPSRGNTFYIYECLTEV